MVEFQPSKLAMRVRFPLPAPTTNLFELYRTDILNTILERDGIFLFYFQYVLHYPRVLYRWSKLIGELGLMTKSKSCPSKQFQGGAYMKQELAYSFHLGSNKNKNNIDRVKKNK